MSDTDQIKEGDTYSDAETAARAEATLKRMLNTPRRDHKPLKEERREREKKTRGATDEKR